MFPSNKNESEEPKDEPVLAGLIASSGKTDLAKIASKLALHSSIFIAASL